MGYLLAAIAAIAGAYLVYDAWMMSLRTETIYQDIYVMIRMSAGMIIFMLATILWALSAIIENGRKAGGAIVPAASASTASRAPSVEPASATANPSQAAARGESRPVRSGWVCGECGKENSPHLDICRCGAARP